MSNLFRLIQTASNLFSQQNYNECLHALKKAEALFVDSNDFEHNINKLMTLRLMAQTYQKLGKLDNAFKSLERINSTVTVEKLKAQAQSEHNQEMLFEQIRQLYTAHGILLLNYSDSIDENVDYNRKSEVIQKCRQKFILAHKITRSRFMASQNKIGSLQKFWFQHYTSDLINLINVYVMQGQLLQDPHIFSKGLEITNKIQKFYEIHKGRLEKKNLYKSYYYKGAILRKMGKYQEAKIYLLKDEKYCVEKKEKELLEANWRELLSLFVLTGDTENAMKRTKDPSIKTRIRENATMEKNLKILISNVKTKAQFDFKLYEEIIDKVEELELDRPLFNELANISHHVLQKHGSSMKKNEYFQVRFTLAEAYFKMKRYQDSLDIILKLLPVEKDESEIIRLMMLRNQVHIKIHPNEINILQDMHNKTLDLARKLGDEFKMKQIKSFFKKVKERYQRLKGMETEKEEELSDDERYTIKPYIETFHPVQPTKKIQLFDTQRLVSQQQSNTYNTLCQQHQIQSNTLLKDKVKQEKSLVLKSFFNLEPQHILTVLKLVESPKSLDLQNHRVDVDFWEMLIKEIEGKRIHIQKLEELCVHPYLENETPLEILMGKCLNLRVLKLNNVLVKSVIKNTYYIKIETLVLNTVNLNDVSISNIPFGDMNQLNCLDLRNNGITGKCFPHLNRIYKRLGKLNLSGNPLHNATSEKLQVMTEKIVLKGIVFTKQLSVVLLPSLYTCDSLALSESIHIQNLISLINDRYDHQKIPIPLKRLKLNEVTLKDNMYLQLSSFFIMCSKALKEIELKFIEESEGFLSRLLALIDQKYSPDTVLDYRGSHFTHLEDQGYRINFWF